MKTIAITSGKGGVGKTALAANLGIALSDRGHRVVLFDADLGLANMDVMLGLRSTYNLKHVLDGDVSLSDILIEGPGGVRVVPGGSGIARLLRISRKRLALFLGQVSDLENSTDVLIFDTGAGIDAKVMTFLRSSDQVLLVVTPDPSSITDAYATAKALFRLNPDAFILVLVNMADSQAQADHVFGILKSITHRFLNKDLYYAGHIRQDVSVQKCIRTSKPFVLSGSPAARDMVGLAALIDGQSTPTASGGMMDRLRSVFGLS